ncbi:MAG TPA: hypothetical protein VK806_05295 [Bacteroidia bacterium]|nr:hypothetical protein [Bacteroidia bacterium]
MKKLVYILILFGMALSHVSFCQQNDTVNRIVIYVKKKPNKRRKSIYVNVAGMVNGTISKDSLLNVGKLNIVDLQKRFKHMIIISFEMLLQKQNAAGKWYTARKATSFSYFRGNEFTDEMTSIIKKCDKGDKVIFYVTAIKYGAEGVGYSAMVNLNLR